MSGKGRLVDTHQIFRYLEVRSQETNSHASFSLTKMSLFQYILCMYYYPPGSLTCHCPWFLSALSQPCKPLTTSYSLHPDTRKTTSLTSKPPLGPALPYGLSTTQHFVLPCHTLRFERLHFTINGEFKTTQAAAI